MKIVKIFAGLALVLMTLVAGLFGYGYWLARRSLPQLDGAVTVPGLGAPVTVYRDAIGVPHIFAQSTEDVAFVQGYVTAQDRLWQMDMFRRNALGELSEVLGEPTLRLDEDHCRLGFREAASRTLEEIDPDSRRILDRYAEGVNAFMRTHLERLPIEFRILRYRPRPWNSRDSLSIALMMAETLNHTWERDIFRARLLEKYGPEILKDLYPTHSKYEIPLVGMDTTGQGDTASLSSLSFENKSLNTAQSPDMNSTPIHSRELFSWMALLWAWAPERSQESVVSFLTHWNDAGADFLVGSNNWVVSGEHTATGKPLLANDPHLAHSIPSIWYQTHLRTPQLNVIGVSLPGAPSIIIGHNEHIAWGMTNLNPDVQDVYAEQFDSDQGTKYLANGVWVEAEIRNETIKIKGRPDKTLPVLVTRHGPVVRRMGQTGFALRWTAIEPHGIGFPFLRLNSAANWAEFTTALKDFLGPTQNFVYADKEGNIGFYDAGKIPIRRGGFGNVTVPGNSDQYDWVGYIPFDELPHLFNPPEGIIATANQRITGDSYPYFITSDWEEPYRFARIHQLLSSGARFTGDDFLHIQGDVYSEANKVLADWVIRASDHVVPGDAVTKVAIEHLKSGDFLSTPKDIETTLVEYLRTHLQETLLKGALGEEWRDYRSGMKSIFLENQLTERSTRWLPREYKNYDDLLVRSLEQVCHHLQSVYGSADVSAWVWGRRYPLLFRHVLGRIWPLDQILNVGPFEQPGTKQTVKQTDSLIGPSMRMVVDFADFDHSFNNLTLGSSGQAFSVHYSDQTSYWLRASSFPMHFSDNDVKRSAVRILTLQP
ncbi:MAG: penicillin acylase family protein [Acidobacteriia bacterium]|nr:penicillin acylase family protein [Terriglobia bacterium]